MFPLISKNDEFTDRFIRLYIANGTVGMLREWVEKDCPVSSEKMAEMMVGREVSFEVEKEEANPTDVVLEIKEDRKSVV